MNHFQGNIFQELKEKKVLDKDGKIFKTSLEGKSGLEKLSEVIVKGTISDQSSDAVTIINAETIQVK